MHGQRGLFEILADLGIPVERILGPPTAVVGREVTLVLWKPQPDLVQVEPAYLHALARWVENGGRVVVAPDGRRAAPRPIGMSGRHLSTRRIDGPWRAGVGDRECPDDRPRSPRKKVPRPIRPDGLPTAGPPKRRRTGTSRKTMMSAAFAIC